MADVFVQVDEQQMRRAAKLVAAIPNGMEKIMSRAINTTAVTARSKIVKALAARTKMKQKDVRNALTFQRATYRNWRARIGIGNKRIPLIQLKARQTKSGVSYVNPATGDRTTLRHAFIKTVRGGAFDGQEHVLRRARADKAWSGGESPSGLVHRLPVWIRWGPSLTQVYQNADNLAAGIQQETSQQLTKNITNQIKVVLNQAKR